MLIAASPVSTPHSRTAAVVVKSNRGKAAICSNGKYVGLILAQLCSQSLNAFVGQVLRISSTTGSPMWVRNCILIKFKRLKLH